MFTPERMTMIGHLLVLVVLKTLNLVFGGLISLYAYRAYRRTGSPALRAVAVGFAVVTVGAFLAGFVDLFLPLTAEAAQLVEAAFTTVGFGVILYSIFV